MHAQYDDRESGFSYHVIADAKEESHDVRGTCVDRRVAAVTEVRAKAPGWPWVSLPWVSLPRQAMVVEAVRDDGGGVEPVVGVVAHAMGSEASGR